MALANSPEMQEHNWRQEIIAAATIQEFNALIPKAKTMNEALKNVYFSIARGRGYKWDRNRDMWIIDNDPWNTTPTKGDYARNLHAVGWCNGYLRCSFWSKKINGTVSYRYGGVPREVFQKLCNSPFPDKLYSQIVKDKYKGEKE